MRIDVNGVGIEVDDQAAEGAATGATVLLLHGWPDTHALWSDQVAALRTAGYRTIAPDLRGFGASDKPDGVEHYAIPHLFTDVVGVLDQLGVERAHVVGHDWGAALAWVLAQGDDVAPIPGTKRVTYLEENVGAAVALLREYDVSQLPVVKEEPPVMAAEVIGSVW